MTYYPSCISDSEICEDCYASETCQNCYNGSGDHPCSDYCNSGCNTICDVAQTFCYNKVLTVIDHADVPAFPDGCWVKDEFIFRNWTAKFWNDVTKYISDASELGVDTSQQDSAGTLPSFDQAVADRCNNAHPQGSLITATFYNQMCDLINFFNQNLQHVVGYFSTPADPGDVIRGAHAMALKDGYESMTFNSDVCDVCNAGNENRNKCNCSCVCSCSCACDCSCSCTCDCSCSSSGS